MAILFNSVLREKGIDPASVLLLRHQDQRAERGRTPYDLWRKDQPAFERYQSLQPFRSKSKFERAPIWAASVGTPDGGTMFAGLYSATYSGPLKEDRPWAYGDGVDLAGSCDTYALRRDDRLAEFEGKLFIEWGDGKLAWAQRAERQNKPIVELRPEFKEPEFPGFLNLIKPLSEVESFPNSWIEVLKNAKGVYLLTCPRTKEQYVGSAYGSQGFWHRWDEYARTGHGGNVVLKRREPSDYQVSVLEVAGSNLEDKDIVAMETRWKHKLQTREMGLNGN